MSHFFSADLHLGHSNIIRYCNRPFSSSEEMDEEILRRFNSRLRPGDHLYLLGDICWSTFKIGPWLDRLNTKEVFVIRGNHDKNEKNLKHPSIRWVKDLHGVMFGPEFTPYVVMCHYPMRTWNHKGRGAYQLYGHVHGMMPGEGRQMDVGVDCHNFYPYSLDEIKERMEGIPFNKYD